MSEQRAPYNGLPFYCAVCGLGFQEYMACEQPACELETIEEAQARKANKDDRASLREGQHDMEDRDRTAPETTQSAAAIAREKEVQARTGIGTPANRRERRQMDRVRRDLDREEANRKGQDNGRD